MKVYIIIHVYDEETGATEIWSIHASRKSAEAALAAITEPLYYRNYYGAKYPAFYINEYDVEG